VGCVDLQAAAKFDAGPIWATHNFTLQWSPVAKSSLYRHEVTEAAVRGVLEAVAKFESREFQPESLDYGKADVRGCLRPLMRQSERAIDWGQDRQKPSHEKSGPPIARRACAIICLAEAISSTAPMRKTASKVRRPNSRATAWCHMPRYARRRRLDHPSQIQERGGFVWLCALLPGTTGKVRERRSRSVPGRRHKTPCPASARGDGTTSSQILAFHRRPRSAIETFREITYAEEDGVGTIAFDFYNGAMNKRRQPRHELAGDVGKCRRGRRRQDLAFNADSRLRTSCIME
jgi:putative two-component system protein, hydrogenase maturation factor HypX/HoxX